MSNLRETLKKINVLQDSPKQLVNHLIDDWSNVDGIMVYEENDKWSPVTIVVIELHTFCDSRNEAMVRQLEKTKFWRHYWFSSQRGGHYVFKIRKEYYL